MTTLPKDFPDKLLALTTLERFTSVRWGMPHYLYGGALRAPFFDHCWTFRYGRRKTDFIIVTQPYWSGPFISSCRVLNKDFLVRSLPREWSWWNPPNTLIFAVAQPGVFK